MNYKIDTGFEDGTTVRFETSNRKLFFRIEQIINDFGNGNEEQNGFELTNQNRNGLDFKNENELGEKDRNGLQKSNGNEPEFQIQNKPQKNSENELDSQKTSKYVKKGYNNRKNKAKHPPITTKFGKAYYNGRNYIIQNKNSKYHHKQLHRLIYEDYHKITLLPQAHIHHIDNNPVNNSIDNLIMLSDSNHAKLHGEQMSLDTKLKVSKARNTSGYFRVCKLKDKRHPNSDSWRYLYREDNKQKAITAKTIPELEKKVKAKGLHWQKL